MLGKYHHEYNVAGLILAWTGYVGDNHDIRNAGNLSYISGLALSVPFIILTL